jgi:DNA-binding Xre family transcriptional regulator
MSRQVSYRWRLRKAMADADMFTSTALIGPLAERGVTLSASQVHRLVTGTPERLNMTVLAALCDILHVSPADLITVDAAAAAAAAAAAVAGTGTGSPVPGLAPPRPRHVTLEP